MIGPPSPVDCDWPAGGEMMLAGRSAGSRCPAGIGSNSRTAPGRTSPCRLEINIHQAPLADKERAQIVDAVGVVGMLVGDRTRRRASRPWRREAARAGQAGCRSRPASHRLVRGARPRSDVRRRRFFGLFGSQSPQPSAGRGTPPEEPQPRMVKRRLMPRARFAPSPEIPPVGRGTLRNSAKKLSVVCCAMSSNDTPRASARTLATSPT